MNIRSKSKFVKRVSLMLALSFITLNFYFSSPKEVKGSSEYPFSIDSNNYDKPLTHYSQGIYADIYKDTPGYQPSDNKVPNGWQFYQTVLFSWDNISNGRYMNNNYNKSPTLQNYLNSTGYSANSTDKTASNWIDNYWYANMQSKENHYIYGTQEFYYQVPILKDTCNIRYKWTNADTNKGTAVYNKMPDYSTLASGSQYVADYHYANTIYEPVGTAPTADFYFNNGTTSATVQAGNTLKVIDGKGYDSGTSYSDKDTKYWSTYWDSSGTMWKHNNNSTLPQSYTYNNAIITHAGWSVTNSSGQNVNDLFNASTGLKNKSTTGAASEMDLTISDSVPPGTYTVHHSVTDNWGSTSGDQTRIFTVTKQQVKHYTLNVSYVDEDTNKVLYTDEPRIYNSQDVSSDSLFGVNAAEQWYLPSYAPSGYTLDTSKYVDITIGYHILWNVDISCSGCNGRSTTDTVNLKVYCKATAEKGTVIKRYFVDGIERISDEEKIEDVSVGSHTYSTYKTYPRYNCENPSITVNVTANSITYCDFNYGLENHPPTVTLQGPETVVMGDDVNVNASGVDPDADPLTYAWNTPPDLKGSASGYTASGYFDNTGDKTYSVTVTDPYGASASASKTVKVVPPVPNVVIDKSGNEKENRKVTLNAEKYSSSGSNSGRYPLDWSKAKWQFFDGSGNELTVDSNTTSTTIVKSLQSTIGSKNMDLIFKKAGKYTAKCTLYNTAGYSNSFSVDLNIVQDLAPTADFNFPDGNNGYRDGKDLSPNGLAQGTDKLVDCSSSRDNDNIGKRMWLACFDSDNDGSFIDITNNEDGTKKAVPEKERWYVFDLDYNGDSDARYKIQVPDSTPLTGKLVTIGADGHKYAYINDSLNPHWRYVGSYNDVKKLDINKINCGNLTSVNFKATSCGHFYYAEEIEESFGQDTIPELITDKDKKQANTFEF